MPMQPVYRAIAANLPLIRPFGPPSVYALRAAFGGCAPTRACGRSPSGEGLELFYIVSGAFTLNIVKMLWMTPRTARQRAMRPCCTVPSASRMRQAL